jgi:hypothetical protein
MMKIKNTKLPMKNHKTAKRVCIMSKESKAEPPVIRAVPGSRTGKIARLPRHFRNELNQRLLHGESGTGLVQWLTCEEQAMNQILGISPREDFTHPGKGDSGMPVQAPVPVGEGNPGDAEKG